MQGRGGELHHGKEGAHAGNSCDRNWKRRTEAQIDGKGEARRSRDGERQKIGGDVWKEEIRTEKDRD